MNFSYGFDALNSDQILVPENVRIMETGTHQSLYNQGGLYKKLVDLQSL